MTHNNHAQFAQSPAVRADAHGAVAFRKAVGTEFPASLSSTQHVIADEKERVHKGHNRALLASARRRGGDTCF